MVFCKVSFRYVSTVLIRYFLASKYSGSSIFPNATLREIKSHSFTVLERINSKTFFALKELGIYFIIYYNDTFSKMSPAIDV